MTTFKKTILETYNTTTTQLTSDQKQWDKLSSPVIVKEFAGINYVDANPSTYELAAVSTGQKVVIYNCRNGRASSTISRFQQTAYGASYRADGQLLIAGSADSFLRLFDCRNNDQLRVFKGHSGPVRRVKFLPDFPPRIASFSDDKTAAVWDITDETKIMELKGHTDFVRAGCMNPRFPFMVVSGSQDRTVRVWDTRTGDSVITLDHGNAHVNDVICFPCGNVLASAAGSEVRIWDLVSGKLLSKLCRHHKDVTSLALASEGTRLMSGSLDHHLKVYDTSNYSVVHTLQCTASILSFAVTPEDSGLVVGMIAESKGILSLQRTIQDSKQVDVKKKKFPSQDRQEFVKTVKPKVLGKLATHDSLLLRYEHTRCLDLALAQKSHAHTVALLGELFRRGALHGALAGRLETQMRPLFRFLDKHASNVTYQPVLFDVIAVVLDVFGDSITADSPMAGHICKLHQLVTNDCRQQSKPIIELEPMLNRMTTISEMSATARNPSTLQLSSS